MNHTSLMLIDVKLIINSLASPGCSRRRFRQQTHDINLQTVVELD